MILNKPVRIETIRVQMADTDAAAVIYLASPLRWAEGIFSRWLAESGHPLSGILTSGVGFPTVKAEATYHSATRMDDVLECTLRVAAIGTRSVDLHYSFMQPGAQTPAVEVRTRSVYSAMQGERKVNALPQWFLNLCKQTLQVKVASSRHPSDQGVPISS